MVLNRAWEGYFRGLMKFEPAAVLVAGQIITPWFGVEVVIWFTFPKEVTLKTLGTPIPQSALWRKGTHLSCTLRLHDC